MAERSQEFFHGTTWDLQGDTIRPAQRLRASYSNWGDAGHSGQSSREHAFATESEDVAWRFAGQAQAMKAAAHELGDGSSPAPGRPRVYRVEPHPEMEKGVYHGEHPDFDHWRDDDLKEWRAPEYKVRGEPIDIMPGRQGTFPTINWNQFGGSKHDYYNDLNHPSDDQVHPTSHVEPPGILLRAGQDRLKPSALKKQRLAQYVADHQGQGVLFPIPNDPA